MRLQAIIPVTLAMFVGCTTSAPESPYLKANPLMSGEISRRVAEIEFQHRGELLDNLLWLSQSGEQAIPFLLKGLEHSESKVRANCAWVLGRIGDRRTIPALQTASRDSVPSVKLEVARSLVLMGDIQQAPALIEGLDSERATVRYSCHEALKTATGRDFGYDHLSDDVDHRHRSVLRWREWWSTQASDPFFANQYAQAHGLTLEGGPQGMPAAPAGEMKPDAEAQKAPATEAAPKAEKNLDTGN